MINIGIHCTVFRVFVVLTLIWFINFALLLPRIKLNLDSDKRSGNFISIKMFYNIRKRLSASNDTATRSIGKHNGTDKPIVKSSIYTTTYSSTKRNSPEREVTDSDTGAKGTTSAEARDSEVEDPTSTAPRDLVKADEIRKEDNRLTDVTFPPFILNNPPNGPGSFIIVVFFLFVCCYFSCLFICAFLFVCLFFCFVVVFFCFNL